MPLVVDDSSLLGIEVTRQIHEPSPDFLETDGGIIVERANEGQHGESPLRAAATSQQSPSSASPSLLNINIDADNENNEEDDDDDESNEMVRLWKESPFAVGLTQPTWAAEKVTLCRLLRQCTPIHISAWCCSKLWCVKRVGNMVILAQVMEDFRDDATGTVSRRPRLLCLVGPYWMVVVGLTIPLLTLVTFWTAYTQFSDMLLPVQIVWAICTAMLYLSLLLVSCTDPGILYRHATPPTPNNGTDPTSWYWNDQALTYRPASAKYDSECAVVVEKFDHTCPWTGTAIGKKNMVWFKLFLLSIAINLILNAALLSVIPAQQR
jgi:DHHC palmitoyltransferase